MEELTSRQTKILKAVIEEYIETAEPVGSETLEKKYSLGISPATIRSEMVKLTEGGYLQQPHSSAGRSPTSTGMKFYIDQLMEEKKLSVSEEAAAREAVWNYRFELDRLLREVTRALALQTRSVAVATIGDDVYSSGYANILDMPEFYDIDVTRNLLSLVDEVKRLKLIFEKAFGEESVHVLLGEELGQEFLNPCGFVFTHFEAGVDKEGTLGVIGPSRLNYSQVIPTVRYFGDLIGEISKNW